jgi:hypothetical protein
MSAPRSFLHHCQQDQGVEAVAYWPSRQSWRCKLCWRVSCHQRRVHSCSAPRATNELLDADAATQRALLREWSDGGEALNLSSHLRDFFIAGQRFILSSVTLTGQTFHQSSILRRTTMPSQESKGLCGAYRRRGQIFSARPELPSLHSSDNEPCRSRPGRYRTYSPKISLTIDALFHSPPLSAPMFGFSGRVDE